MQRAAVLWRASPARLVLALFALMLAAAMAVGSGANFNATSANPGNLVTAGILDHANNKDGAAVLAVTGMVPGQTRTGTVALSNTGDVPGRFSVRASGASATPNDFDDKLELKIENTTDGVTVFGGNGAAAKKLSEFTAAVDAGTWNPGVSKTYTFTVSWPDGGANGADNAYQGATTSLDLDWESVSVP
jgi:hypothetical protein